MTKTTATAGLFILAAIALIGVIVLAACNRAIPNDLWAVTLALVGAVAGVSIPSAASSTPAAPVAQPVLTPAAVPPTFAAPQQPVG